MTFDGILFQKLDQKLSQIVSETMGGGMLVKVLHFVAEMSFRIRKLKPSWLYQIKY